MRKLPEKSPYLRMLIFSDKFGLVEKDLKFKMPVEKSLKIEN